MKIWIDIVNSPQVTFFKPIIDILRTRHQVTITARKHSQTLELLDMYKMQYTAIGEHAGKSKLRKAFAFIARVKDMYRFSKGKDFDCAIVHQSPYCLLPAWLRGIKKRIFIFDNETAKAQNLLAIPFSTVALCPSAIKQKRIYGKKLSKYPGIKESVYINKERLKDRIERAKDRGKERTKETVKISHMSQPNASKKKIDQEKYILMRPEPWSAAYYNAKEDVLGPIIDRLCEDAYPEEILVVPRDEKQKVYYKNRFDSKIKILTNTIPAEQLISKAKIVIGAGGSMNREAVVLGVPVISTYQGKLLAVDKWLIDNGYMHHATDFDASFIDHCIKQHKKADFPNGMQVILKTIES